LPSDIDPTILAPALLDKCRLIKLRGHTKVAMESGWNTESNYSPEDPEIIDHIEQGFNYGIMPTNGLIVIDCDTEKLYSELPEEWKESLTVITGREGDTGRHLFLYCPDSPPDKIAINDPETRAPSGDIRGTNSKFYTVGAGSIHPDSGKKYQYVNPDSDLIEISWDNVKEHLIQKYAVPIKTEMPTPSAPRTRSMGSSLSEKLRLRIEDFAMPNHAKNMPNGDIQGAHPIYGSTTGMNFAINPRKNVWHSYRSNIGGDPVSWIAYAHCGVPESDCNDLNIKQFMDVKEWLRNNGYAKELSLAATEYFESKEDPAVAKVDISKLIQKKKPAAPIIKKGELEPEELEKAKKDAEKRVSLPEFPELESGIFHDYIEYGKRVSYSLPEFHFASFLTIASMSIRRKVIIEAGPSSFHPNVFAMVVGQTTISGKSVACDMAIDSFEKSVVYEEQIIKFNSTKMMRGTRSEPALIQSLNDVFNSLWYYDDCGGFFDDIPAWNAHIIGTLCTAYDGREVERELSTPKKSKKDEEKNRWSCPFPFLSLLFNMTTSDLERVASARLFSSGFFPRFMWFYGQGGKPRKNEKITIEDKKLVAGMANKVLSLRLALSKIPNDGIIFEVCDPIEQWKMDSTMSRLDKKDEMYRAAIGRGFVHAYKIAAILSMFDPEFQQSVIGAAKYPIEVAIPEKHALMAIKIVEKYLVPRMVYIQGACSASDPKNPQTKVVNAITVAGGHMTRTELIRATRLSKKDLKDALDSLVESEEIDIKHEKAVPGAKRERETIIKL